MDSHEDRSHSFIVKVWIEETGPPGGRAVWRGRITHVPSGARRYLRNLRTIPAFIAPYLSDLGVQRGAYGRLRDWLRRRRPE
jgi:hypothetical protein